MKVPEIDFDECVGCASCVEICPDVFQLSGDKAIVINAANCKDCDCQAAADICPVMAIKMVDG